MRTSVPRAGEDQRDLLGPPDADVVGDQRVKEAARAARIVEHQCAADLDLAHRELPPVAGGAIFARERRRQLGDPAVEESLHVLGAEAVADRLQHAGLITGGEAVRERAIFHAGVLGLALGPFVPVDPDLRRVREVGADLDKARTEVGVEHVEVVDADAAFLAEEFKPDGLLLARAVAGAKDLEGPRISVHLL
jgi:hypothetical protein